MVFSSKIEKYCIKNGGGGRCWWFSWKSFSRKVSLFFIICHLGRYMNAPVRPSVRLSVCPSVRPSVRPSHLFDPLAIVWFSRNFQDMLVLIKEASGQYGFDRPKKVKVTGVNGTGKLGIFGAFSRTPPRVFIQPSSNWGIICRIIIQKNVGSRNFEFLTQSFFSWGQELKKMVKIWKMWFFCRPSAINSDYSDTKNAIISYLQSDFKNVDFWPT